MKQTSDMYQHIFSKSADGMLIIEDGLFIDCNDAILKMLGYEHKDHICKLHPSDLSPKFQPDGRSSFEKAEENTQTVLKNGHSTFEWVHTRANGEDFWVEVVLTNISNKKDKILFLVVWREIGEKKALEEHDVEQHHAIMELNRELQRSAKMVSRYVIHSKTDLTGVILEVSKAFCKISGYSQDELVGSSFKKLRHPDMPKSLYAKMWKTIESGNVWHGKIKNLHKDGGFYWVFAMVSPVFDENGVIECYSSIRHEITDAIKLQELNNSLEDIVEKKTKTLHDLNHDLEKKVEAKVDEVARLSSQLMENCKLAQLGEMMENITHQWKQPLNTIASIATNVELRSKLQQLDEIDLEELMATQLQQTEFLSNTMDTFKTRLNTNSERIPIDVAKELKDVLSITSFSLKDNYIEMVTDIDETISHYELPRGELEQVVINIINNAKDALVASKRENSLVKVTLKEENETCIISIEDNGGGIPEDVLPKIFDSHFTTKGPIAGTGIGLHMSRKIVQESLGGKLYAKNGDDGAQFFIEIPRHV
jgi:PAS domain S-box-containing protein